MSIITAIIGLGILVLVHEAGHMWVARLFGMRVERFSIFFGPPILRWTRGGTSYQVGPIPLGGFVQIAGMNPNDPVAPNDPGSYRGKPFYAQFATVLAGPVTNYLFAILIFAAVGLGWGRPTWDLVIASVQAESPASAAGLRAGDRLLAVDEADDPTLEGVLSALAKSGGEPVTIRVQREEERVALEVTPRPAEGTYRIGIMFGRQVQFAPLGVQAAIGSAVAYPFAESAAILQGLLGMVTGKIDTDRVGGPVEIVRQLKRSFETSVGTALMMLALLNVYLGLFNLLPLPALDGGRLCFIAYSMVTRRAVNPRVEHMVHALGFLALLTLLLMVTYRDIIRLF